MAQLLWQGSPDPELLDAARTGALSNEEAVERQVRRMLTDARAEAFIIDFSRKWLHLRSLDEIRRPPVIPDYWTVAQREDLLRRVARGNERFPEWDEGLREALRREVELFVISQVRDDRPVVELWTADYSFLNDRLAAHYGLAGVTGPEWTRVQLPDDARRGLLGKGGILAMTSLWDRTSPVQRSKWVGDVFFNLSYPAPPRDKPVVPFEERSVRSVMEEATSPPQCSSCHSAFDPFGFALENYDALGRWRVADAGVPIDASGRFWNGRAFRTLDEFRAGLVGFQDVFAATLAERLVTYSRGRSQGRDDIPQVDAFDGARARRIASAAKSRGYRWSAFLGALLTTEASAPR
jgi:hypothetical protein